MSGAHRDTCNAPTHLQGGVNQPVLVWTYLHWVCLCHTCTYAAVEHETSGFFEPDSGLSSCHRN